MNKVFEHAGDLVNVKVAHNLMKLIAEGFGEDDDTADSQLRSSAVRDFHTWHILTLLYSIIAAMLCYLLIICSKNIYAIHHKAT